MKNGLVLVGNGSELLSGSEGLKEIVEKFTVANHKLASTTQTEIVGTLKRVTNRIPLDTERAYYEEIIDDLVCKYLLASFQRDLPEVDPLLFSLQRTVSWSHKDNYGSLNQYNSDMPLLARVSFGKETEWKHQVETARYKWTFESDTPPAPLTVREDIKEMQRRFHKAVLSGLETDLLSDALQRDLLSGKADLSFQQYWIPKDSELKIKVERIDKDPFVTAQLYGKHYLVSQWDVETEEPYKHYLGEFTK